MTRTFSSNANRTNKPQSYLLSLLLRGDYGAHQENLYYPIDPLIACDPGPSNNQTQKINRTFVGNSKYGGVFDGVIFKMSPQVRSFPKTPIFGFYSPNLQKDDLSWNQYLWPFASVFKADGWNYSRSGEYSTYHLLFTRDHLPRNFIEGRQMIGTMGVANCIGGTKAQQLHCRREYAKKYNCKFEDLRIQPFQYDMHDFNDCNLFFQQFTTDKVFLAKPTNSKHGDGIDIYFPEDLPRIEQRFGTCSQAFLLVENIKNPVLIDGHKIDLRTYLLVASMRPKLAFIYKHGIFRKSSRKFDLFARDQEVHILNSRNQSLHNHFYNYTYMNRIFENEYNFGPNFIQRILHPQIRKIQRFVFESQIFKMPVKKYPVNHRGRFHIFAMDWIVDTTGHVFLLEGNRFPAIVNYPEGVGVTPNIWYEFLQLIKLIQIYPRTMNESQPMLVRRRYAYRGWELIYNEIEEMYAKIIEKKAYDPCREFLNEEERVVIQNQHEGFSHS